MKYSFLLVISLITNFAYTQSRSQIFESIRASDMHRLSELFDKNIEYCFNDQIQFLDKASAVKAVKAFLDVNVPKSVTPIHKGESKSEDSNFSIATMEAMNGKKFRIYVYTETSAGKALIKELRIDIQK
jgi:hypothetical protein